jgi:uncharacterized protein (UPF0276 family)
VQARASDICVGIGARRVHFESLIATSRQVDFLQIVPEVFLGVGGRTRRSLDALHERFALLPHGVSLSVGGPDPLDSRRLADLAALCAQLQAPYYSDHLCLSSVGGIETFDLIPLPFNYEAACHAATRVQRARAELGLPIALENIVYYATMPDSSWDEGRFLSAVLDECNAGLLLDVSNVLVNARNQGLSAPDMLAALPLDRTVEIHLAGHRFVPSLGLVVDDHASLVSQASIDLYEHALRSIGRPVRTLIEWDQALPDLDVLLDQADRVRSLQARIFAPNVTAPEGARS